MILTPSNTAPLGAAAADFALPDAVSGGTVTLADIKGGKGTLLMFICNHCPFVQRIEDGLAALGRDYAGGGIGIAAISANDAVNYPEDAPDKMKAVAQRAGYVFPYLYDETQEVARAYDAVCTPDFFLFDGDLKCVYRGQFDAARPNNKAPATGEDLRRAMDLLLADEKVPAEDQQPSVGCSIKWK